MPVSGCPGAKNTLQNNALLGIQCVMHARILSAQHVILALITSQYGKKVYSQDVASAKVSAFCMQHP